MKKEDKQLHEELTAREHQYLKMMAMTQTAMARPQNLERIDLDDLEKLEVEKVRKHCQKLGMIDEINPVKGKYPLVALMAAFQFRVEERLKWLLEKMRSGDVQDVETIIVCAGKRKLRDFEEATNHGCEDETDMVRHVMKKLFPADEFPNVKFVFSDAKAAANDFRARTDDTAVQSKEDLGEIEHKELLLISNQPYCGYQGAVFQQIFHPMHVQSVGDEAPLKYTAPDIYDSITRLFYANALRHLVCDKGLEEAEAKGIIGAYKKEYQCESLITRVASLELVN